MRYKDGSELRVELFGGAARFAMLGSFTPGMPNSVADAMKEFVLIETRIICTWYLTYIALV